MKRILLLLIFILSFFEMSAQDKFKHYPTSPHYIVVLPKAGWADMKDMVGGFAKHNVKYFTKNDLFIKQYKLTRDALVPFLLVGTFENETDAMLYFNRLKEPPVLFLQAGVSEDFFFISAENYNQIIIDRTFKQYRNYFHQQYPN